MPSIGPRCCELRIPDRDQTWRIIYRIDEDLARVCAEGFLRSREEMGFPLLGKFSA